MPAAWVLVVVAALGIAARRLSGDAGRASGRWSTAFGLCVAGRRSAAPVYAAGLQRFVVAPNEQAREAPFIEHNIAATREAFALDASRSASCRATRR